MSEHEHEVWTDEKIADSIKRIAHNDIPDMRTQSVTTFQAEQLMGMVRADWIADRSRLLARVAEATEANTACTLHIASQNERINRFVELVDQLEAQLAAAQAHVCDLRTELNAYQAAHNRTLPPGSTRQRRMKGASE